MAHDPAAAGSARGVVGTLDLSRAGLHNDNTDSLCGKARLPRVCPQCMAQLLKNVPPACERRVRPRWPRICLHKLAAAIMC